MRCFAQDISGLRVSLAACCLMVSMAVVTAQAETLDDALAAALAHHPALQADNARLRAARAGIDAASSGYMPRVTASGDVGASSGDRGLDAGSDSSFQTNARRGPGEDWTGRWRAAVNAEQPLFDGFRTSSAVSEARAGAEAASEQVRASEHSVLLDAANAYADVFRDRRIKALREADVAALSQEVQAAADRLARGAASSTDVAQAAARRAQAIGELATAKASVEASSAEYARIVGRKPGELVAPSQPATLLPRTLETALGIARQQNPAQAIAFLRETASRHAVDRLKADGLPQVKLRAGLDTDRGFSSGFDDRSGASVALRVVVPLYDGGETQAKVRQAQETRAAFAQEARGAQDKVAAAVAGAWARLAGERERLASERHAVEQSRKALAGIREEIRLGQKATIDGLNAQRELVTSQVRVAGGERDLIVAAYTLLATTGQLTIANVRAVRSMRNQRGRPGAWRASVKPRAGATATDTWTRVEVRQKARATAGAWAATVSAGAKR